MCLKLNCPTSIAMLSHRLRRVLVAVPSIFQRSCSLSRASDFPLASSLLLPRSVAKQPTENFRSPARLFSTTQYQYDPYTGEDSFTPDNEGCDFNHWLITMDFPKDNPPSREEMISIFEQTCAKGLGISLEEAKKKIYAICTTSYQGFQATMTIGEVEKFRDLPGVQYIIPDSYVDVENKMYGGDKYENGVITPGPVPVPTREGFDFLAKESTLGQEQAQRSPTPPVEGLTSGQVKGQESQTSLDQRPFNQTQGALAVRQGQAQGSAMPIPGDRKGRGQGSQMPTPRQDQPHAQGSQMPSFQRSFRQHQGTPAVRKSQAQGSQMPSFQGSFNQDQGTPVVRQWQAQGSHMPSFQGSFNQGQGTPSIGQGQAQESQMHVVQQGYSQGQGTPIYGQGKVSRMPSYQMGYSQDQGAQTPQWQVLPNNYGQGTMANYNQGLPQGNFIQGTQENYNQMGQGNYGPALGAVSPGFGHGYSGHGQGGQLPSYQMGYNQGLGALVHPYQGNYIQGTANNYGQWAFANYNQGPLHGNVPQGLQQNYIQGGGWNFSPQSSGNCGPPQSGHTQYHRNQMPQYQLSYNQSQGAPFYGKWQCQGCGMVSYHVSCNQGQGTSNPGQRNDQGCTVPSHQANYSHSQGASVPPFQGNYNNGIPTSYGQGTSANFNQGIPLNYNQMAQGNYNPQSVQNYGSSLGTARDPGFTQGQNQTFQQEDRRSVAGDWNINNNPTDRTTTGKIPH